MRVMPDLPARALSQASATVLPIGLMIPSPVTTTLRRATYDLPWALMYSTACDTVVIFSASSSGISVLNSSSSAITSSTVSSESAPRSSTKDDSFLISASFTPSCSAMIFLTRCSTFSITSLLMGAASGAPSGQRRARILRHIHPAVDVQHAARDISAGGRRKICHSGGHLLRRAQPPEGDLREQRISLFVR